MNRATGLADGTRLRVTGGGPRPLDDEELAALALAIGPTAGADAPPAPSRPAWLRAARLEGVTAGGVASPADLRGS